MLDLNKSTLIETIQHAVATGVNRMEEGMALVAVLENGKMKVKPATGAAGEHLVGVSIARAAMPTIAPRIEDLVVPATGPYTVNLGRTPAGVVGATVLVNASTRTNLTAAGAADTTHFSRSGQVVTFDASFAGKTVQMRYSNDVSTKEATLLYGFDAFVSVDLALAPVIGVIREGIIYTSCYDPLVDWDAIGGSNKVQLATGGIFTMNSGGQETSFVATVYETPSANNRGMLALLINQ